MASSRAAQPGPACGPFCYTCSRNQQAREKRRPQRPHSWASPPPPACPGGAPARSGFRGAPVLGPGRPGGKCGGWQPPSRWAQAEWQHSGPRGAGGPRSTAPAPSDVSRVEGGRASALLGGAHMCSPGRDEGSTLPGRGTLGSAGQPGRMGKNSPPQSSRRRGTRWEAGRGPQSGSPLRALLLPGGWPVPALSSVRKCPGSRGNRPTALPPNSLDGRPVR